MNPTLIRADSVGKSYVLQHQGRSGWDKNRTLRDELTQKVRGWFVRSPESRSAFSRRETFWALRDVSFQVRQGEAVGFIGHNGAGKSTLLKLLSRITEPTTGEIAITGRVASLLEVGTGFHAELTGRENIYLKGAIMGMKRAETRARFDEIVDFAGVERFLDTPVKRYSSGMYVKLGFAVAAHLNPEILILDEVLAVGDAQFQRKCIEKMQNIVSGQGKTILFVSHNLGLVQAICSRAILLQSGTVVADGPAEQVAGEYLAMIGETGKFDLSQRTDRGGLGHVRITQINVDVSATGRPARLAVSLSHLLPGTTVALQIIDKCGNAITNLDSAIVSAQDRTTADGTARFVCELESLPLIPGSYSIDAHAFTGNHLQDTVRSAAHFNTEGGGYHGRVQPERPELGSACFHHRWITPANALV